MPTMRTIRILHRATIIAPLYLLLLIVVIVAAVDIEFIRNLHLVRIILAVLLFFVTVHLIRILVFLFGRWVVKRTARNFTREEELNRYRECRPIAHCSGAKREHLVLLLHGFTTSPMEWRILGKRLDREGLDFYAPLIYGFGQINQDLILAIHKEDWFRQIVDIYDLYSQQYEKISVIGHSMGGMLACYLAQVRPVHELILSAPALFPARRHSFYSRVVKNRLATYFISWLIPMVPKPMRGGRGGPADTMDSESTYNYFQYLVAPVRMMFAMLEAQTEIKLQDMTFRRLSLLHGAHDITVDNPGISTFLHSLDLSFTCYCFKNSAHNIFLDYDREEVNDLMVTLLRDEFKQLDPEKVDCTCCSPDTEKGDP